MDKSLPQQNISSLTEMIQVRSGPARTSLTPLSVRLFDPSATCSVSPRVDELPNWLYLLSPQQNTVRSSRWMAHP
jgi:hypothetical protein